MTRAKKAIVAAVVVVVGVPLALLFGLRVTLAVVDDTNGELVSSGVARDYILHVPEGHDPSQPVPLVISMHAAAMWPARHMKMTGWNQWADSSGFLVVYPGGTSVPRAWHADSTSVAADVRFIADLIEAVSRSYAIDRTRVYADGLSNGGRMAWVLSCRLPDVIAAVGTVAAANDLPWAACGDAPPVPAMLFHGTEDPVVPYEGGTTWASPDDFPSAEDWAGNWARRNRCTEGPVETRPAADVTRRAWVDCAAPVVFYTLHGAGHTWPGGKPLPRWLAGPTATSIDATALLWTFFQTHSLE